MDSQNNAIGAIGSVLGYIGAEGATTASCERLLWPSRAYAGFRWPHAVKLALLAPGGGPVYKAALEALDKSFKCGLLRGSGLGHMLGSVFFPQSSCSYLQYGNGTDCDGETKPARNCLWTRVVMLLPTSGGRLNGTADIETSALSKRFSRGQVSFHHITLSVEDLHPQSRPALDVGSEDQKFTLQIIAGIFCSEVTGIVLTILVAVIWNSWLAVLWILPLLMKLVAAAAALDREHLVLPETSVEEATEKNSPQTFEVTMSLESGTFLILTGPPNLILQFFRHYGHPERSRVREVIQLTLIVALACIFPVGLVVSVTTMPEGIQYLWISHQMYLVLTMYFSRYMSFELWASTEEMIAGKLARSPEGTFLWADKQTARVVRAGIDTTFHARYGDALAHAKQLVRAESG